MKAAEPEHERHDWIIIPIILLIGFLCVILAGGWALRFSPNWKLNANMESNINPNIDFLTSRPNGYIEPVDPSILTPPAWINDFLTPGALHIPRTPFPTPTAIASEKPTTISPLTSTAGVTASPTKTLVPLPWIPSSTARPKSTKTNRSTATPTISSLPIADLQIAKSDGVTSYSAGGSLTYTITVMNSSATPVTGARISDNIPSQFTAWSWSCASQNGGASGCDGLTNSGTNFSDSVDLPGGASIVYTVNAMVSASANGNLKNTATITAPGYTDPAPANNSASDTDTQTMLADLSITKTDGVTVYAAGSVLTYTVTVTNSGASAVIGAIVTDSKPSQIAAWSWACTAQTNGASGCDAVAASGADFSDTVDLPVGSSITYDVTVNISNTASGDLTNTASVNPPANYTDAVPANNVSTDIDGAAVDLQITKSDGVATYTSGNALTYTVVVTNNSTFDVNGAAVTDSFSAQISSVNWSCSPSGSAACTANGTGDLNDVINIPAGLSVTYTITANVSAYAAGTLVNTASVTVPAGFIEIAAGDNSATDSDASSSAEPDIGPPDGSWTNVPQGTSTIIIFDPAIVADGDAGTPDLVYYERLANPTRVDLDSVQVEISADGSNWYQVFYWGDGSPDTNTNMDVQNLIGDLCPTEIDNCNIPIARMYNSTGITIDIDSIVPSGNYPWMRITSPASPDPSEIDAIQPYYP
ncbi:MAG TPA: hypothetical protein VK249_29455 [Anaerolineales bacterium]|nr:hypothetical protein [Anaerolineales bacterium]